MQRSKEEIEQIARRMRVEHFGEDYRNASLSRLVFPQELESAANALKKFTDQKCNAKYFLIFTGPTGTSKTFISAALVEWGVEWFYPCFRIWKEYRLNSRIKKGYDMGLDHTETLDGLIDHRLVMIDDVGANSATDWCEERLFEAIEMRYSSLLPTIFTTNLSKKDFYDRYHERIGSRLFATRNTVIDTTGFPDFRTLGY